MKISIKFDCDNAAFAGDYDGPLEVERILRELGTKIVRHGLYPDVIALRDINGNTVGQAKIVRDL